MGLLIGLCSLALLGEIESSLANKKRVDFWYPKNSRNPWKLQDIVKLQKDPPDWIVKFLILAITAFFCWVIFEWWKMV